MPQDPSLQTRLQQCVADYNRILQKYNISISGAPNIIQVAVERALNTPDSDVETPTSPGSAGP